MFWSKLTNSQVVLLKKCTLFNLIAMRFHDFVHTGHLNKTGYFF